MNVIGALVLGAPWPSASAVAGAGIVGFLGYGTSLVLFMLALRALGTGRTGAYFSTAPGGLPDVHAAGSARFVT